MHFLDDTAILLGMLQGPGLCVFVLFLGTLYMYLCLGNLSPGLCHVFFSFSWGYCISDSETWTLDCAMRCWFFFYDTVPRLGLLEPWSVPWVFGSFLEDTVPLLGLLEPWSVLWVFGSFLEDTVPLLGKPEPWSVLSFFSVFLQGTANVLWWGCLSPGLCNDVRFLSRKHSISAGRFESKVACCFWRSMWKLVP